ncbi:MAG TPA: tRNA lysidine(34) synthetase TilS [Candidatus Limnocylindria bacterium]|nr:tRNA lysidine(34) synthetase TilS [Candidatus Limnocylindria bacterium]
MPLDQLAAALDHGARALDIPDDAHLVLAVSGGPDSMAMLHAAAHLVRTDARSWQLTVAHLDHQLRPDSADDAAFVADAAVALELPAEVRTADVAALARAEGRSIEDAAREARYRFLEEIAPEQALIATAHTLDDLAETVLINLMRGSGLTGVRGMPARRGRIVRPLLGERRSSLRGLLDAAGIGYRLDPSNEDPAYLRNRVRHELLPLLEELRPGAVDRIGDFARLAADDDALLDELAAAELERRRDTDEIDWRDPPVAALGRRVLRLAIGPPAPSAERLEALLEAAAGDRGGIRVELGNGRTASVRGRRIRIE